MFDFGFSLWSKFIFVEFKKIIFRVDLQFQLLTQS